MATELILQGRVQGVYCRYYCSQYGRKLDLNGCASNRPDGTVQVVLETDDRDKVRHYISCIKNNPDRVHFYGHIDTVSARAYSGPSRGDYNF